MAVVETETFLASAARKTVAAIIAEHNRRK
jgi:hypothetical protein